MRLEKALAVPHIYRRISVNDSSIIGQRHILSDPLYHFDLLDNEGRLLREFGRNYSLDESVEKPRYIDLNFLAADHPAMAPIDGIGRLITWIPQTILDRARNLIGKDRKLIAKFSSLTDHLIFPLSHTSTNEATFVFDRQKFITTGEEGGPIVKVDGNISVFDSQGNGLRKMLKMGEGEGDIPIGDCSRIRDIQIYGDSLFLFDAELVQRRIRIKEFDLNGGFVRDLFNKDIEGYSHNSHINLCANKHGIYVPLNNYHILEDCHNKNGEAIGRVSFDGKITVFPFNGYITGIAASDENVFVATEEGIISFDKDLQQKDILPRQSILTDEFAYKIIALAYNNGTLYVPIEEDRSKLWEKDRSRQEPITPTIFTVSTQ